MFVIYTYHSCRDSDQDPEIEDLSPYELKRLENIARNKRKLEEIFGTPRPAEANLKANQAKKIKVKFILTCMSVGTNMSIEGVNYKNNIYANNIIYFYRNLMMLTLLMKTTRSN